MAIEVQTSQTPAGRTVQVWPAYSTPVLKDELQPATIRWQGHQLGIEAVFDFVAWVEEHRSELEALLAEHAANRDA